MRSLTSEERVRYGTERIFNESPDAPNFLSDDESGALEEVAELLSTQFDRYETTHRAVGTLGIVASFDARGSVRLAAANAFQVVVRDHSPTVRIRSVLTSLARAVEARREKTDPETLRVLIAAYKGAEVFQKSLPIAYRPATVDDARAMAELATREISGRSEDITWRTDRFGQGIETGTAVALVAQLNDEIVGMAFTSVDNDGLSTLEFLAVVQKFSRCGIGGKLLQWSMHEAGALGAHEMQLKAFGDMTQDYYRRFGFIGPRDEMLITMQRPLDGLSVGSPMSRDAL